MKNEKSKDTLNLKEVDEVTDMNDVAKSTKIDIDLNNDLLLMTSFETLLVSDISHYTRQKHMLVLNVKII